MRGAWGAGRGARHGLGLVWACRAIPGVEAEGVARRTGGRLGGQVASLIEGKWPLRLLGIRQGELSPTDS